jgi:hypothetical protein
LNDLKNIPLHEYEQSPPEDFWLDLSSVLDSIDATDKKLKEISDFEVAPPQDVWLGISQALDSAFEENKTITQKTETVKVIGSQKEKVASIRLYQKKWFQLAVAACVIAGLFSLYQINQQKIEDKAVVTNIPSQPPPPIVTPPIAMPDSPVVLNNDAPQAIAAVKKKPKRKNQEKQSETIVSNNIFEIEDEDAFFLTLANYILPANNNGKSQLTIRVDQYATLNISPKMALFMRGLYERTGKRQKPTRTARRSYRALRSWKKTSNKFFGERRMHNVADPFVLAEFLDDNKRL